MAAPNTFNRGIPRSRKIRSQLQTYGRVQARDIPNSVGHPRQQYRPAGPSKQKYQANGPSLPRGPGGHNAQHPLSGDRVSALTQRLQAVRGKLQAQPQPNNQEAKALGKRYRNIRGMLAGRRSGTQPIGKPQPPQGTPLGPKPPLGPPGPFPGSFGPRTGPPTGGGIGDPGGPRGPVPRRRRIGGGTYRPPNGRPIGY